MSSQKQKFVIQNEHDVSFFLLHLKEQAQEMGFAKQKLHRLITAVSEIGTNVHKHAKQGWASFAQTENGRGIEILIVDEGPGIADLEKASQEGHSTVLGSLGIGIAGAKRLSDDIHFESKVGEGTRVTIRAFLDIEAGVFEYSAVSLPLPGEIYNGDACLIKEMDGDKLFVAILDGGGHGREAKEKTEIALAYIEQHFREPLESIISGCDKALIGSAKETGREKGVVLALCVVSKDKLIYLGVGDTKIKVISEEEIHPLSRGGVLGFFRLPTLRVQEFNLAHEATIILATDGVMQRYSKQDLPLEHNAAEIAAFIMNTYQRGTDDASVIVIKKK